VGDVWCFRMGSLSLLGLANSVLEWTWCLVGEECGSDGVCDQRLVRFRRGRGFFIDQEVALCGSEVRKAVSMKCRGSCLVLCSF
jgi:hypothetical protein